MTYFTKIVFILFLVLMAACSREKNPALPEAGKWVGIHLLDYTSDSLLVQLALQIPSLAKKGINLIFLEVDYSFEFQSDPDLRLGTEYITREGAQKFAAVCKKSGIRIVPEFQSFGHQSWANKTFPLLTKYPELDMTPGAFPDNEAIYCREWDPTNPRVNEIVFPMIDEIVAAFEADAIHLGMDELFLISSEKSPSTFGKDPAKIFAQVVNEFHDHFVKKQGLEMFIWADRLIDGEKYKYGEWESSLNGTAAAIDMIPKDIIMCDWHYEPMESYPSVPMFLEKGFRVLPCSFRKDDAIEALIKYSYKIDHPNMLGHLFTTWGRRDSLLKYPPLLTGTELINSKAFYDVTIKLVSNESIENGLKTELKVNRKDAKIFFTTDGNQPDMNSRQYVEPIILKENTLIKALAFEGGKPIGKIKERRFAVHKSLGAKIELLEKATTKFEAVDGAKTLVNGILGSNSFADGQWLGFEGKDLQVVLDFGEVQQISKVSIHTSNHPGSWVYPAGRMELFDSEEGKTFEKIAEQYAGPSKEKIVPLSVPVGNRSVRFLKIVVYHQTIPEGKSGAGKEAWLFVDELMVE